MSDQVHGERLWKKHLPSVLRSRKHLEDQGVSFLVAGARPPESLPIADDGATFNMAQEVTWVDQTTFAVGRWDGTLSLFRFNDSPTAGPLVTKTASTPAMEGVQMIVWLGPSVFVTSNDETSVLLWSTADGTWNDLASTTLRFDATLGVANSGDLINVEGARLLAIGHANGHLSVWVWRADTKTLEMRHHIDLRTDHPTNPWGLHNIRGVSSCTAAVGCVVTGSENGLLCMVDAVGGRVLSRTSYNPAAQRGINSITLLGKRLLVANCAVGAADSNLWLYDVDVSTSEIHMRDSARLVVNPEAPQVFNFCTVWGSYAAGPCFFSSTEEGALWMGTVGGDGKIALLGYRRATSPLGAALAYNTTGRLVLVAHDLYEYRTGVTISPPQADNPERIYAPVAW